MKNNNFEGKLISFCGLDGCGKTTQINRLKELLTSFDLSINLTKQPTDFVRKSEIFRTFMDTPNHDEFDYQALSLLAASDRVQHSNKVISPALERGNIVISDRYFYSCLANLRARGYTHDKWIYDIAKSITKPDIAFFLDTDVDIAIKRVRSRESEKDRYIDVDLQYRLREQYLEIAYENGGVVISTNQSEDSCFKTIKRKTMEVLKLV